MGATKIQLRQRAAFLARYERDAVPKMTSAAFEDWVNTLPLPEFFAMMDFKDNDPAKPRRIKREVKPGRLRLCNALSGIAAFHIKNADAQKVVYRAVRELQRT